MSKGLVIVYNGASGSALPPPKLKHLAEDAGFAVVKIVKLDDSLGLKLQPFIVRKLHVAAVGGDGTISAVAQHLVNTRAVLVPIPGGTLNHFTKDLQIDQDIAAALKAARHTTPHQVDVASVNDKCFINNSSIGLYPQSLRTRKRAQDKLGKWPAAVYAVLRAFVRFRTYRVKINHHVFDTPFIFVGNGEYKLDNIAAGGRVSLTDGILCVYIVRSKSRWSLLRLFSRALIGKLTQDNELLHFTTDTFTIDPHRQTISVSHDGEVSKLTAPVTYKLFPKSLWITSPK